MEKHRLIIFNGIIALFVVLAFGLLLDMKCSKDNNTSAPDIVKELKAENERLKQDSITNAEKQAEYDHRLDSLSRIKKQKEIRYATKIKTIYAMPDSIIYGLLAKHLDSLYTHRFDSFASQ